MRSLLKSIVSSMALVGVLNIGTIGLSSAADDDFIPVINRFSHDFAIPAYSHFNEAAKTTMKSVGQLCKQLDKQALGTAQTAFSELVASWSIIEAIRFGPIRDKNRFEKIFFWPDPRSRGFKQVYRKMAELEVGGSSGKLNFRNSSVAIQGLPALEFLLYGAGFEVLVSGEQASTRCEFAAAISQNIFEISEDVLIAWTVQGGYADFLNSAGKTNSVFQSHAEVMQNILKSGSEILLLAVKSKLDSSVQKSTVKAKPKRAPFWRSNLTILNLRGNMTAIVQMHEKMQLVSLLPAEDQGIASQFAFEAEQVQKTFQKLESDAETWLQMVATDHKHELLRYVQIPMESVEQVLSSGYPELLGLQLGFNALDGD